MGVVGAVMWFLYIGMWVMGLYGIAPKPVKAKVKEFFNIEVSRH
jgi:hypothetical protein